MSVLHLLMLQPPLFGMLRGERSDDKNNRASHISQKHYYQTPSYSFDCDLHCTVSFRCTIGCAVGANIIRKRASALVCRLSSRKVVVIT